MAENLLELISKSGKITTLQDKYFKRLILCLYTSKKRKFKKFSDLLPYKNIKE